MSNPSKRRALICGISGQDGAYLSKFLLDNNYEVWGTTRKLNLSNFSKLDALAVSSFVKIIKMTPHIYSSVMEAITKVCPNEIYYFSGQSSVANSFIQPVETFESITLGVINILEAIRITGQEIKFYNAGSSESFGGDNYDSCNEETAFNPQSPYAVAKSASAYQVKVYREVYGIFASTGILFNHESPLRPENFVTRKIVTAAHRIALGSDEKLLLGNLDISRDWGWAPEYVRAVWLILQQHHPEDFVIGTGKSQTLRDFVATVFNEFGLKWDRHVVVKDDLKRIKDPIRILANPEKAKKLLLWEADCVGMGVPRRLAQLQIEGKFL